jgi:hypothetical protein
VAQVRRRAILAAAAGLAGAAVGDGASDAAFLSAWCRLEAVAKATGCGIGRLLTDLGLRGAGRAVPTAMKVADRAQRFALRADLQVHDLQLPSGLAGAVALERGAAVPAVAVFPADRRGLARLLAP